MLDMLNISLCMPWQVQVQLWEQCPVLCEEVFRPILQSNYYTKSKFLFELDTTQTQGLLAQFGLKGSPSTGTLAPPSPSPPLAPASLCPLLVSPVTYFQPAAYTYPSFTPASYPYYTAQFSAFPTFNPVPSYSLPAQAPAVCIAPPNPLPVIEPVIEPPVPLPVASTAFDSGVFTAGQNASHQVRPNSLVSR